MALLTQQALRNYEQSNLYSLIHNFQKQADDDHLIVYRHPINEEADQNMRSKNPERNLRRQRREQQRYDQNENDQRVSNDLGSFLGEDTRQLPNPQGNNYNGNNYDYGNDYSQQNNQLPSPQNYQQQNQGYQQAPNQRINAQPDYQIENDSNSLNSPQMNQGNAGTYYDLNQPNYYDNLNNDGNGYYQQGQEVPRELPNVTATNKPNQVRVGQQRLSESRQLPSPQQSPQQQQAPQVQAPQQPPQQQQIPQEPQEPQKDTVVTQQPDEEPETDTTPTITYTDADGNTTEQEEIPVDMPNTNDSDNEESYSVDSTKPEEDDRPSNEVEAEEIEDVDNSAEKSRIFQEIQGAINTRKWIESIQEIQLAQKANFDNLPLDHIDLIGISNGVSDGQNYRVDLDPMFFKLFKIVLIGQNLDITLLARDGNSTEISIAPPDWVQNDKYKDILIDGNYLYSYTDDLDFDKLMDTLHRFTYRPVQTKGYTELFITDLPIYPLLDKNKN